MPETTIIKIPRVSNTYSQASESSKTIHIRLFDSDFSLLIFQLNLGSRCFSLKRNHVIFFIKFIIVKYPSLICPLRPQKWQIGTNFLPFEPKLLIVLLFVATLVVFVTGGIDVATFVGSDPLTNTVLDPDVSPKKPSPF